jgi:ribosomal protein S18 acetylase RimI-like enzyme
MPIAATRLRPFGVADATLVASWLDSPGIGLPPGNAATRWAERLVADPRVRAWVAVRGTEPVGFVRLDVGPDRVAELTIAVSPVRRRQGIGTHLLQLLRHQAQQIRVRRLQAVVDPGNAAALSFFAESGFEEADDSGRTRTFVRWLHEADREVLELEG